LAKAAGSASVDMKYGSQTERHAEQQSWHESPLIVRWQGEKQWIEAHFREVYWADFGMAVSVIDWLRMLWWIISMPGVRIFSAGDGGGQESANLPLYALQAPAKSTRQAQLFARMYLGFICSIATPLVLFAKPIQMLVERLISWDIPIARVLMHTLGNVMLYQDAKVFMDRLESFNEKRRNGIRRRMVQGLLAMATDAELGKLDAFYVIGHSLGTVIAFNALMECPAALPNFLSREEWENLPKRLKISTPPAPPDLIPPRPPWLKPGDSINRQAMLEKCRGFLTAGCPLDKFAALWPAIVPISTQQFNPAIRWVNVADGLDIVANHLHYFPTAPAVAGGLKLENHWWGGAFSPVTAHTSYWNVKKPGQKDLMNWIVGWLEDESCPGPVLRQPPRRQKLHLLLWLILLGFIASLLTSAALTFVFVWITRGIHWQDWQLWLRSTWLTAMWLIGGSIIVVSVSSLARRIYEWHRWGPQK
jgi:pimeloyl-ACP methyl ester carboxylesterase